MYLSDNKDQNQNLDQTTVAVQAVTIVADASPPPTDSGPLTAKPKKLIDVTFREANESTEIKISIPEEYIVSNTNTIDDAYRKTTELIDRTQKLAKEAFVDKNKPSWDLVQVLLYYWNRRDLLRVERINDYTHLVEYALRKIVLDVENTFLPEYKLESFDNFTPERAIEELADKVYSHRINEHPLLNEMAKNGVSLQTVQTFLENYYINNRLFHLFIAALSLSTPMAERTELANNFYDELGSGDCAMAHPNLFLKNFNNIGRPNRIEPMSEALSLVNAKTYAAFLCGDYHCGMGGFGYIELAMPNQMVKILAGLRKSGLPAENLEFWETHIHIDLGHGKAWFSEMRKLIHTPEQAQKCLKGGMRLLNARAAMYDGVWRLA
ncbi:MAG: iron-containing redox enzyme family protein [Gammaproteobacteria bacterium]